MPGPRLVVVALATVAAGLAASPALAARSVSVRDNVFAPKTLTVKKNSTVRFVWRGSSAHNAVGSGAARFSSKIQRRGSFRTPKLRRKGTVRVVCTLHSGMRMTLRVR